MLKDNVTYLSTAAHCGSRYWYNASSYVGVTTYYELRNYGDTDAQLIQAYGGAAGWVYTGPTSARGVATYSTAHSTGEWVCADGAMTGEVCGAQIVRTGQCIYFVDFRMTVCGLIVAQAGRDPTTWGDSGGPVYNVNGDGSLNARGLIVGGNEVYQIEFAYTPIHIVNRVFGALPLHYY